jgi:hypothetical protein
MRRILWIAGAVLALAACTEKPQELGAVKQDAPAYQGTGMAYAVSGWKQGDKGSWESQLKARTQMGQNDYNKVN